MNIGDTLRSVIRGMPALMTGGRPGFRAGDEKLAWARPELSAPQVVSVISGAFADGEPIPARYSADGVNMSPPLAWTGLPDKTRSVAVVVEDPDAPLPAPFVHWLIYNIPPAIMRLPEDLGDAKISDVAGAAMQGKNSNLRIGWAGMAPPKGDVAHRYFFQVFALNTFLSLEPGAGRGALFDAMTGHVIGRGMLTGTYGRG